MKPMIHILISISILLVPVTAPATGDAPTANPDDPLMDIIRIRTTQEPRKWLKGDLVGRKGDELTLLIEGEYRHFQMDELIDFQVRTGRGNHAGSGAGLGALLLGVTSFGFVKSLENDSFFDVEGSDVLKGTVVGILAGGMIGGLIGAVVPRDEWKDVQDWMIDVEIAPDGSPGAAVSIRF